MRAKGGGEREEERGRERKREKRGRGRERWGGQGRDFLLGEKQVTMGGGTRFTHNHTHTHTLTHTQLSTHMVGCWFFGVLRGKER